MACNQFQQSPRSKGSPGPYSRCRACQRYHSEHKQIPPTRTYPRKDIEQTFGLSPVTNEPNFRIKGGGEILLNEIIGLVFPGGKEVQNPDELNLRLHLVIGLLYKYGYGPGNHRLP